MNRLLWPCILEQTSSMFRSLSEAQQFFSKNIHDVAVIYLFIYLFIYFTAAIDFKQLYPKKTKV